MFGWLSSFLQIKIKQKAKYNLTGDNEILRSLHSKRNIKTKTKMFLPIRPDLMGRSASTWLRKCDQFSLFQSLSAVEAGPKILEFSCTQKRVKFFSVFQSCCCYVTLVKYLVFYRCHFSFTTFTILERSTYNGQEERWRGSGKTSACLWKCWFCWRCCNICYSTY